MISNPLVSILVPSYNHAAFVEKCIDSIINQDYDNWLPKKLSLQVKFLENNPNYGLVYGKAIVVDENDKIMQERTVSANRNLLGGNIFKELLFLEFHPPVNYLYRAKVIQKLGFFREDIWAEDFDMNLRIGYKYPIGFLKENIFYYRVNNSIPSKNLNFKTIYSHKNSIDQFKDSEYYNQAIKLWHFRCFTWYAPFYKGKKLALKGMAHSLDKIFNREFWHSFALLLFRWH